MPRPPPPPAPSRPRVAAPVGPRIDYLARALARNVADAHGIGQAATLDLAEELGAPRGFVGTRNLALDRSLGALGIPLGRITEISGWPGAGKSTMADQILAQCMEEGGVGVLADTERTRNLAYMEALGIEPRSLVWLGGRTVEAMFDEGETLIRTLAHHNALAWADALRRAGVKVANCPTYTHGVYETADQQKPNKTFTFAQWGREQQAALIEYQRAHGLKLSATRDVPTRAALRPVVIHGEGDDAKAAMAAWEAGEPHPLAEPADRPVVWVWDSVAGTPTEEELEGSARDPHVATAAKVIKRNLRRMVQLIDDEAVALVLVNQRYERIQMNGRPQRGPATRTYGGGGIEYHTTIRVEVEKVGDIMPPGWDPKDRNTPPLGQIVQIGIEKNKVGSPYRRETFGLVYGRGAENAWTVYNDLKERGIIRVGGGWSQFTDSTILGAANRSFRGWMDLSNMMAEDTALWVKLRGIYLEAGR